MRRQHFATRIGATIILALGVSLLAVTGAASAC